MGTKDEQIAALEEKVRVLELEVGDLDSAMKDSYDEGYSDGYNEGFNDYG
jgi:uncharacterized protein (UPF0335 family)